MTVIQVAKNLSSAYAIALLLGACATTPDAPKVHFAQRHPSSLKDICRGLLDKFGFAPPYEPKGEIKYIDRLHTNYALTNGVLPYYSTLKNRDAQLTIALFESAPKEVKEGLHMVFAAAPDHPPHLARYLQEFVQKSGHSFSDSFLANLEEHLVPRMVQSGLSPHEQLKLGIAEYRTLNADERAALRDEAFKWAEHSQMKRSWNHDYRINLPLEMTDQKRFTVQIGKGPSAYMLSGEIRGEDAILQVPTSRVKHPAWNPLVNLTAVIQSGEAPPKHYFTSLGLDGNFYLLDGNHRFAIYDAQKDSVHVKLRVQKDDKGNAFVSTINIREHLDMLNLPQPQDQSLRSLFYGHISPLQTVAEPYRNHILWPGKDLKPKRLLKIGLGR